MEIKKRKHGNGFCIVFFPQRKSVVFRQITSNLSLVTLNLTELYKQHPEDVSEYLNNIPKVQKRLLKSYALTKQLYCDTLHPLIFDTNKLSKISTLDETIKWQNELSLYNSIFMTDNDLKCDIF